MSRFLFILQFDSFIKTLLPVIDSLQNDHEVDIFLFLQRKKKDWITPQIEELLGDRAYTVGWPRDLEARLKQNYDVAVLGSVGARFITHVREFLTRNNLDTRLASGYVGALLQNNPKGFVKGVMRRAFTDLIWTQGTESRIRVLNTGFVNQDVTQVTATGLPRFDDLFNASQTWSRSKELILYIEQPTFPESRNERLDLVKRLANVAEAYPQRKVVIKPRFGELAGHAHRPHHLLPDLMKSIPDLPENLIVSYENLQGLYPRTDFALSISSTGALEALLVGVPAYFISDFCGDTNRYGSSDFKDLGNVVSFEDICQHRLPEVDAIRAQAILRFDGQNTVRLTTAIGNLATRPPRLHRHPQLRVKFSYPGVTGVSTWRQGLISRHRRRPEQIAAWSSQSVELIKGGGAHARVIFGHSPQLQLIPNPLAHSSRSLLFRQGAETGHSVRFKLYVVAGQIISMYPVKTESSRTHDLIWQLDDLQDLKNQVALMGLQLNDDSRRQELLDMARLTDQASCEIGVVFHDNKFQALSVSPRTEAPGFQVSPDLKQLLLEQRETLEESLGPIYTILDEVGWWGRYFAAIDRAFRSPEYPR